MKTLIIGLAMAAFVHAGCVPAPEPATQSASSPVTLSRAIIEDVESSFEAGGSCAPGSRR